LDALDTVPEQVLDRGMLKKGNAAVIQVLIKWTHLPSDAATWEDWDVLVARFPAMLAWGQASSPPGGVVTTTVAP